MPKHLLARHAITVQLPVDRCQRLFTPAGEELWVDGWQPVYHHPGDGSTQVGMIFATGSGDDYTLWALVDFESGERHYARYMRVTPALRSGFVEVTCTAISPTSTRVDVAYDMTALTPEGEESLRAYEPAAFEAMIEEWRQLIDARLPALAVADIR